MIQVVQKSATARSFCSEESWSCLLYDSAWFCVRLSFHKMWWNRNNRIISELITASIWKCEIYEIWMWLFASAAPTSLLWEVWPPRQHTAHRGAKSQQLAVPLTFDGDLGLQHPSTNISFTVYLSICMYVYIYSIYMANAWALSGTATTTGNASSSSSSSSSSSLPYWRSSINVEVKRRWEN